MPVGSILCTFRVCSRTELKLDSLDAGMGVVDCVFDDRSYF
jgi:hypothetical protein